MGKRNGGDICREILQIANQGHKMTPRYFVVMTVIDATLSEERRWTCKSCGTFRRADW
jgi:hypothetical protein